MNCRCCRNDEFSTLSYKVKCISILLTLAAIICTIGCVAYFIIIRNDYSNRQTLVYIQEDGDFDASVSDYDWLYQDHSQWAPLCPEDTSSDKRSIFERVNCYPEGIATEKKCLSRGCCFGHDEGPKCFYPPNYGYSLDGNVESIFEGFEARLRRLPMPSRYGDDIQLVKLKVDPQTPYTLRVTFSDPDDARYEVPDSQIKITQDSAIEIVPLYSVNYNTTVSPFGFKIRRTNTETAIFDTNLGGFTFSPQFLQLSSRLPSKYIYGLGDNGLRSILLDTDWETWTLFSRHSSQNNTSYGVHPFYICLEEDGRAHGVLLLNSNAMEFQLLPQPALTFRAYGGLLDFYFFLGPTPKDVIRQYLDAVGHPVMPPYWSLGHHLSLRNVSSTGTLITVVDAFKEKEIPLDVITVPVDYIDDHPTFFSHDENVQNSSFQNVVNSIHSNGQRLMFSISPGINADQPRGYYPAYDAGAHLGVFINDSYGNEPLQGMGLFSHVVYPDFGNPSTSLWWIDRIKDLHSYSKFDGLFIDMNSPRSLISGSVNGCLPDNLNKPPYFSIRLRKFYNDTLCMNSWQWWGSNRHQHYDLHNLYGYSMSKQTDEAVKYLLPDKRTLIISSSTFVGSGRFAGHSSLIHSNTWDNLRASLATVLQYGLFGLPFTGAIGCDDPKNEELCLRSLQLSAFSPYFQTSNLDQALSYIEDSNNSTLLESFRATFKVRYELLPYLYTLFHHAHMKGEPVASPLWMQFPSDNDTYAIEKQYMWGEVLMISLVLDKGLESVSTYFPVGAWYDFFTGEKISSSIGQWKMMDTYLESAIRPVALFVRGGFILPGQIQGLTTNESRRNPMTLFVALDDNHCARGNLFWDDGETQDSFAKGEYINVDFEAEPGSLKITCSWGKPVFMSDFDNTYFQQVKIAGLTQNPTSVQIDGKYNLPPKSVLWEEESKLLFLHQIRILLFKETVISWSY